MTKNEIISNTLDSLNKQRERIVSEIEGINYNEHSCSFKYNDLNMQIQNLDFKIIELINLIHD